MMTLVCSPFAVETNPDTTTTTTPTTTTPTTTDTPWTEPTTEPRTDAALRTTPRVRRLARDYNDPNAWRPGHA